jgi:hypothetical protein
VRHCSNVAMDACPIALYFDSIFHTSSMRQLRMAQIISINIKLTNMANVTIPPKSRAEWSKLISGEIDHKFKNYVLQIRIYQMRKDISMGRLTLDAATTQLYELCCKYSLAVQADCKDIFKTW